MIFEVMIKENINVKVKENGINLEKVTFLKQVKRVKLEKGYYFIDYEVINSYGDLVTDTKCFLAKDIKELRISGKRYER